MCFGKYIGTIVCVRIGNDQHKQRFKQRGGKGRRGGGRANFGSVTDNPDSTEQNPAAVFSEYNRLSFQKGSTKDATKDGKAIKTI